MIEFKYAMAECSGRQLVPIGDISSLKKMPGRGTIGTSRRYSYVVTRGYTSTRRRPMAATSPDPHATKSSSYGSSAQEVKYDVDALRSDIASLANSVSKLASEKAGVAASEAQAIAKDKLGDIESAIRQNPTQSALIAVGVGFLIGLVLTR
jgi:ElaB/YqjD/DUF883 family membrane-anchored ribosome-binding protein